MKSDPLSDLWNSDANRLGPTEGERIAAEFVTRLRRRRRFQAWWLSWTVLALSAVTLLALGQLLGSGASAGELVSQWTLVPLLILPWLATAYFLRAFFSENRPSANTARPLPDVLIAMSASNARERRRLVVVLALLGATTPIAALAIHQLQLVGKVASNEATSMALVFGVALALGGAAVALRLRFRLQPERRRIELLLRDLEPTAADRTVG